MQLSKNFFLKEFIFSSTAARMGIDNYPGPREIAAIKSLCVNVLQPLRDWYGKPIRIGSGYRSPALNAVTPGASKTSQHRTGEAADPDTVHDNGELFEYIKNNLPFDQLIWEYGDDEDPDWIHVSYKADGNNRHEVLKAYRDEYGVHYAKVA
jgi:hypothetical protein